MEEERDGGKGYSVHKTTVVSDTLGNPLKDTRGSSPNFFIKLISITSIIMAGLTAV
ncbi:MAG: sodium/proton-translocating pyrophosphatase, partial [Phocaeicola sp.]